MRCNLENSYVLSNVKKMYSGAGPEKSNVHLGVDIVVVEGNIKAVVPHRQLGEELQSLPHLDCSSLVVVPGIVDAHTHVTIDGLTQNDLDRLNGPAGGISSAPGH